MKSQEPGQERKTYTVEEAAKLLGIGRTSAYQASRTGELPTIRVGRRLVVPVTALDRLLSGSAHHEGGISAAGRAA